jgi:hypothetical protein
MVDHHFHFTMAIEACVAQLLTAGEIDEADVAALVAACGCERVGEFAAERSAQQLLFARPPRWEEPCGQRRSLVRGRAPVRRTGLRV